MDVPDEIGFDEDGKNVGEDPDEGINNIRSLIVYHQSSDPNILNSISNIDG